MTLALSSHVHLGRPLSAHGLALVPLFPATPPVPFADLAQAVADDRASVEEEEAPTVPSLRVRNKADQALLVVEGALLIGGLQDRICGRPTWLPARSDGSVPVHCVEARRWQRRGGAGAGFRAERADVGLRHARLQQRADQGATWRLVAERRRQAGLADESGSIGEVWDMAAVERLAGGLDLPWGACGVVVAWSHVGVSRWPLIEWYASPSAFRAAWPGLRRSMLGAHLARVPHGTGAPAPRVALSDVALLLAKVDRPATVESHGAGPGAVASRFQRGCMEGWATRVGERLVHVGAVRA